MGACHCKSSVRESQSHSANAQSGLSTQRDLMSSPAHSPPANSPFHNRRHLALSSHPLHAALSSASDQKTNYPHAHGHHQPIGLGAALNRTRQIRALSDSNADLDHALAFALQMEALASAEMDPLAEGNHLHPHSNAQNGANLENGGNEALARFRDRLPLLNIPGIGLDGMGMGMGMAGLPLSSILMSAAMGNPNRSLLALHLNSAQQSIDQSTLFELDENEAKEWLTSSHTTPKHMQDTAGKEPDASANNATPNEMPSSSNPSASTTTSPCSSSFQYPCCVCLVYFQWILRTSCCSHSVCFRDAVDHYRRKKFLQRQKNETDKEKKKKMREKEEKIEAQWRKVYEYKPVKDTADNDNEPPAMSIGPFDEFLGGCPVCLADTFSYECVVHLDTKNAHLLRSFMDSPRTARQMAWMNQKKKTTEQVLDLMQQLHDPLYNPDKTGELGSIGLDEYAVGDELKKSSSVNSHAALLKKLDEKIDEFLSIRIGYVLEKEREAKRKKQTEQEKRLQKLLADHPESPQRLFIRRCNSAPVRSATRQSVVNLLEQRLNAENEKGKAKISEDQQTKSSIGKRRRRRKESQDSNAILVLKEEVYEDEQNDLGMSSSQRNQTAFFQVGDKSKTDELAAFRHAHETLKSGGLSGVGEEETSLNSKKKMKVRAISARVLSERNVRLIGELKLHGDQHQLPGCIQQPVSSHPNNSPDKEEKYPQPEEQPKESSLERKYDVEHANDTGNTRKDSLNGNDFNTLRAQCRLSPTVAMSDNNDCAAEASTVIVCEDASSVAVGVGLSIQHEDQKMKESMDDSIHHMLLHPLQQFVQSSHAQQQKMDDQRGDSSSEIVLPNIVLQHPLSSAASATSSSSSSSSASVASLLSCPTSPTSPVTPL